MIIAWDDLDDYLKMVSLVTYEIESIKKAHFQLGKLRETMDNNLDVINISASFFFEVFDALEYKVYVGTMKIFDKSGSASLNALLNQAEQQRKTNVKLHNFILLTKKQLQAFENTINIIKQSRDQYYAHLDKEAFDEKKEASYLFDNSLYEEIKHLLDFAWETLDSIFCYSGAKLPPQVPLINDLPNIVNKLKIQ